MPPLLHKHNDFGIDFELKPKNVCITHAIYDREFECVNKLQYRDVVPICGSLKLLLQQVTTLMKIIKK